MSPVPQHSSFITIPVAGNTTAVPTTTEHRAHQ